MTLFHIHKWQEVSTDYCEPHRINTDVYKLYKMSAFGFTIIYFKCSICGDVKSKEVIGRYNLLKNI